MHAIDYNRNKLLLEIDNMYSQGLATAYLSKAKNISEKVLVKYDNIIYIAAMIYYIRI